MAATNAVCVWDFTAAEDGNTFTEIETALKDKCKKWTFQLERGEETGYLHYQGRVSLKLKSRLPKFLNKVNWKPTSTENRDNMFYVSKEETRVEGPWADTDPSRYVPKHLLKITEWRPWQQKIVDSREDFDDRKINVVVDVKGNIGKTSMAGLLMIHQKCSYIPFVKDYKDIMRMVMDMPKYGMYIIDLPRAVKKEHQREMWAALETVKGGYAYDDRYSFKYEWFDSPTIWVFTNQLPDLTYQSLDRWALWTVKDNEMHEYEYDAETPAESPNTMGDILFGATL